MQNRTFPKKIKNKTTIWSNNSTSGYISKEVKIKILNRHLCFHILCSLTHNSQDMETAQAPSMVDWIKKMWHLHTMECYSAFLKKKKERRKFCHVQHHGWTWKALCWVMHKPDHKNKNSGCHSHKESKRVKSLKQRVDWGLPGARGGKWERVRQKAQSFSIQNDWVLQILCLPLCLELAILYCIQSGSC